MSALTADVVETELQAAKRYAAKWKALAKRKKLANDDGIKHAGAAWRRILKLELTIARLREHPGSCDNCQHCTDLDALLAKPEHKPKRMPQSLSAVYYDCRDSETLTHEEPDAAVEELVDHAWEAGKTNLQNVAKLCPIKVNAFSRMKMPDSWVEDRVDTMIEMLDEYTGENWGDPDGDHGIWNRAELEVIRERLRHAMRAAEATATVWQCEVISSETYEAEKVLEMLHDRGYFS